MELQQLEFFCVVAQCEHMTKAAEKLHISQPALSLTIRRLESELGVALFDRKGRSISLNKFGRTLLERVAPALKQIEEARQALDSMMALDESRVTISTPSLYAEPQLMERIIKAFPNILINQQQGSPQELAARMQSGKMDFAVTSLDISEPDICSEILKQDEIVMIVSEKRELSRRVEISLSDCGNEVFIVDVDGASHRRMITRCLEEAGVAAKQIIEGNGLHDVLQAVSLGVCVSLLPRHALEGFQTNGIKLVKIVNPVYHLALKMYWPRNRVERPVAAAVRNIIAEYYKAPDSVVQKGLFDPESMGMSAD